MINSGTIVRFPSGAIGKPGPGHPGTVAAIANDLFRDLGGRPPLPCRPASIPVRLEALCGVADETVSRLAAVAAAGVLTPESAARLALRHAREIGRGPRGRGQKSLSAPGRYDLHLCGTGPESFAAKIESASGDPWVASATARSFELLLAICPGNGRAICLLVNRAATTGATVRLVTTRSWRNTLIDRSTRPGWRSLRHLLIVGGLPSGRRERSEVAAAIVSRLRSQPHPLVMNRRADALPAASLRNPTANHILQLLAVVLPTLFAPEGPVE